MLDLAQNSYNAKAYELLTDYRFPSWLYQVTNGGAIYNGTNSFGASTCWEHWNSWVSGSGGNYAGSYNSFNHFRMGSVGEWIYRNIGRLNPHDSAPGFQNVILEPQPGGGITNALASFNSIHGRILCSWTNNTATTNFSLSATVPANVTGSIYVPSTNVNVITESVSPRQMPQASYVTK